MLSGLGVVAIWNGITDEGRDQFYEWHIREHMPERVGIPGFLRGRRYRAIDAKTFPEFFTLYETETFEVTQGTDYANRLNAPTPWTKAATGHFRDTARGLARVLRSEGVGSGGVMATIRFALDEEGAAGVALADAVVAAARMRLVSGAHICRADDAASAARTAESKGRADIQAPPGWFVLIEACTAEALDAPVATILSAEGLSAPIVGRYAHEHTRLKTPWTAG